MPRFQENYILLFRGQERTQRRTIAWHNCCIEVFGTFSSISIFEGKLTIEVVNAYII